MDLQDLSAARDGEERLLPPTPAEVAASLRRYGLAVLKTAFVPGSIQSLLAAAEAHGSRVEASVRSGTPLELDPFHLYLERALASNLTALDPATSEARIDDLTRTTLYTAIMTPAMRSILAEIVGVDAGWALARVRVVAPWREGRNGLLGLHMEKVAIRFPNVHNIWTPLTPPEIETNFDAPGIQFYLGRQEFFTHSSESEASACLGALAPVAQEERPVTDEVGFFYRPKLKAGDLAIFDGSVPHGSFIPKSARAPRVGCDFRVFPWTETNHLPAEAIRMGQRHARLT